MAVAVVVVAVVVVAVVVVVEEVAVVVVVEALAALMTMTTRTQPEHKVSQAPTRSTGSSSSLDDVFDADVEDAARSFFDYESAAGEGAAAGEGPVS